MSTVMFYNVVGFHFSLHALPIILAGSLIYQQSKPILSHQCDTTTQDDQVVTQFQKCVHSSNPRKRLLFLPRTITYSGWKFTCPTCGTSICLRYFHVVERQLIYCTLLLGLASKSKGIATQLTYHCFPSQTYVCGKTCLELLTCSHHLLSTPIMNSEWACGRCH